MSSPSSKVTETSNLLQQQQQQNADQNAKVLYSSTNSLSSDETENSSSLPRPSQPYYAIGTTTPNESGKSNNGSNTKKKKKKYNDDDGPAPGSGHGHGHKKSKRKKKYNVAPEMTLEHAVTDAYESVITDTEHDEDDEDTRWLRQERLNHKLMKWHQRPSLLMISVLMFLYSSAVGIAISAKVELLLELACKKIILESSSGFEVTCQKSQLQVMVSQLQSWISITGATATTLLAGKIGEYSDIHGRKQTIIYVLTMAAIAKAGIVFFVSPARSTFHLWALVGVHLIESFGGGVFVFLGMCNSYITDVVEDHARIYSIGIVIAMLNMGLSVAPLFGSLVVKFTNSNMTAMVGDFVIAVFALLFAIFVLPESRSANARSKSRRNSISAEERRRISATSKKELYYATFVSSVNFFKPLKMLWLRAKRPDGTKDFKPRIVVLITVLIDVCLMTCTASLSQIFVLYGTYMFDWNAVHMGYYISISNSTKTSVLILFSPVFLHYLKKKLTIKTNRIDKLDITCIRFAVFFQVLSAFIMTVANSSPVYIAHTFAACFESIATPTLHSTVIKYASIESTGAMFGALATVRNLVNLVMPATLLYIYSKTVALEPRVIFYIQAAICVILVILVSILGLDRFYHDDLDGVHNLMDGTDDEISLEASLAALKLQKEQRERVQKYMTLRRQSSSSSVGAFQGSSSASSPSSPINQTFLGHTRTASNSSQLKR